MTASKEYQYLFGPVPSRRLGRSLGVDPVPTKTCTYECIYCQLGKTPNKTVERREWVPTEQVVDELRRWATEDGEADIVTIAGSGEPTLHTDLGRIIEAAHERTSLPVAVLTNGSLLYLPEVRRDLAKADIVKVTLSAANLEEWKEIHRPASDLEFDEFLAGLRAFRQDYQGQLWLEVMLMEGVNATEERTRELAEIASSIGPDKIQINTPVRPPAEAEARPVEKERLERLADLFSPRAEVIGEYKGVEFHEREGREEQILGIVRRHPCTLEDLSTTFGLHPNEVSKHLRNLLDSGRIQQKRSGEQVYYLAEVEEGKA